MKTYEQFSQKPDNEDIEWEFDEEEETDIPDDFFGYGRFINNYEEHKFHNPKSIKKFFLENDYDRFIIKSFDWEDTPEGKKF